jgi:hypothetical protein
MSAPADAASAAANPLRGEVSVVLNGQPFVMLPSFEAIVQIEEQLGSAMALARKAARTPDMLTLQELAVIITEGIRAHGRDTGSTNAHVGLQKIKKMIFEAGQPSVLNAVAIFLVAAVTGGSVPKAEPEPGN